MLHRPHELPLSRRLAEAAALTLLLTAAYLGAGAWSPPHGEPLRHVFDARIPFVPESVWLYLPGYWACFVVPVLVLRDARQFRAAMTGLTMLTVLATPFFLLFPVAAPRPPLPSDATLSGALVQWLYATDPVGNTFPSLHVANATYCAVVTTAASRRWGAVVWGLATGVAVSVLTLKQHWLVDIPAAWALATCGAAAWRAQLAAPSVLAALPARMAGWWAPADTPPVRQRVRVRAGRRRSGR